MTKSWGGTCPGTPPVPTPMTHYRRFSQHICAYLSFPHMLCVCLSFSLASESTIKAIHRAHCDGHTVKPVYSGHIYMGHEKVAIKGRWPLYGGQNEWDKALYQGSKLYREVAFYKVATIDRFYCHQDIPHSRVTASDEISIIPTVTTTNTLNIFLSPMLH